MVLNGGVRLFCTAAALNVVKYNVRKGTVWGAGFQVGADSDARETFLQMPWDIMHGALGVW